MGVPDSFLDKYNPDEFLILGRSGDTDWVLKECDFFTPPPESLQKKCKNFHLTFLSNQHSIYKHITSDARSFWKGRSL